MKKLEVKNLVSARSGCAVANQFIIFTTSKYLYQFLKEYTDCNITCKKELEKAIKNGVIQLVEE